MSHVIGLVDAHQHYWDVSSIFPQEAHTWFLGALTYPWKQAGLGPLDRSFLPDDLSPALAEHGVERTVLVNVLHSAAETSWMLDLADRTETVAGVVGWLELDRPAELVEADLTELEQHPKLVGLRHLTQFDRDERWLVREATLQGLAVLAAHGVPFDLLVTPRELALVAELSDRLPELRMVVDHAAKPAIRDGAMQAWSDGLRLAAESPNVLCKLSGLVTEADHGSWSPSALAPYVEVAFEAFGAERVMFGSDWPVCTLAGSYHDVFEALRRCLEEVTGGNAEAVRQQVFADTAAAFYGLPDPGQQPT